MKFDLVQIVFIVGIVFIASCSNTKKEGLEKNEPGIVIIYDSPNIEIITTGGSLPTIQRVESVYPVLSKLHKKIQEHRSGYNSIVILFNSFQIKKEIKNLIKQCERSGFKNVLPGKYGSQSDKTVLFLSTNLDESHPKINEFVKNYYDNQVVNLKTFVQNMESIIDNYHRGKYFNN